MKTSLPTLRFGNSDMDISRIGVGAWAIGGGGWAYGWGHQDDDASIGAIHRGIDAGINWLDTAPVYGLGHSEEVVARALAGRGASERPYLFTKCGMVWDEKREVGFSLKKDSIRKEIEASLRRLKVDHVDLYQIHWPNPDPEIEEGWEELARIQKEGKARYIGVSNFSVEQMKRAQKIAPITSLQPPYSVLERGIEAEILPFCREHNIGVIAYSPMKSGLLSGKMTRERVENFAADDWRRRSKDYQEPNLSRNLELVELLKSIGETHGRTAGEVAIAWTLREPTVTAAIVGVRSPEQIDGVVGAARLELSRMEVDRIENFLRA